MGGPLIKSLRSPDDLFRADLIEERSVQVGEQTIGRATVQPGWRWSVHLQPSIGTRSCMVRHVGLVVGGRFHVRMDDGSEVELGPDDVFDIPPGHDAWVVGEDVWETVEIAGIYGFGRVTPGGGYVTSILITDIVGSTAMAARLGESEWNRLLSLHLEQCRRVVDRYNGVPVKTTGDGLLATFQRGMSSPQSTSRSLIAASVSSKASTELVTCTRCRFGPRASAVAENQSGLRRP